MKENDNQNEFDNLILDKMDDSFYKNLEELKILMSKFEGSYASFINKQVKNILEYHHNEMNKFFEEYVEKIRKIQKDFSIFFSDIVQQSFKEENLLSISLPLSSAPPHFKDKVKNILKKVDTALTSKDLMDEVNKNYPDKIYSFPHFSAQLSNILKKKLVEISNEESSSSGIIKIIFPDEPMRKRHFYGLLTWIKKDKEKDKDEFTIIDTHLNKLKNRYHIENVDNLIIELE